MNWKKWISIAAAVCLAVTAVPMRAVAQEELVQEKMLEELKADKEKTKAGITGVEIAARIIKECKPYCQGVHIMALGWESKIPDLLKLAEI